MGLVVYWFRRDIQETPEFKAISEFNRPINYPLKRVFSLNKKEFMCSVVFGGSNLVPLYLATVYMNTWLLELGLTRTEILLDNTIALFCSGLLMPLTGFLADRFTALKMMRISLLMLGIFSIPLYIYVTSHVSWQTYIMLQAFLIVTNACIITPLTTFLPTLFHSAHRYTGISVSYTLGQAILGGMTPLFATLLTSYLNLKWAPSLLLCVSSLLFLIALKLCQNPKFVEVEK